MTPLNTRLTGVACILTGISFSAGGLIHVVFGIPDGHWLMYLGYPLLILTLAGLYGVQARQTGLMGLAGFILAVFGSIIQSTASFVMLADVTGMSNAHDMFMYMLVDLSMYYPSLYAFVLGLVLLGLATAYGRVLPRFSGVLLALAAAVYLPSELAMSMFFTYYLSTILLLVSLVWMGIHLVGWKPIRTPALQPQTAIPSE